MGQWVTSFLCSNPGSLPSVYPLPTLNRHTHTHTHTTTTIVQFFCGNSRTFPFHFQSDFTPLLAP